MSWKAIHRWLGLTLGTLAVVLGITGAVLAIDPVLQARQAPGAPRDLQVATLLERVSRTVPGAEEIRRVRSGAIVVFSFAGDQPQASYVDPADGRPLGAWQPSTLPRWIRNLHRSLLLGDAGRWIAVVTALAMGLLCLSAFVLLVRRLGGWRRLAGPVRGTIAQRIHVVAGRVVLMVLCLTSLTALTMSASTLGLVQLDTGIEPELVSVLTDQPMGAGSQLAGLSGMAVGDLRTLTLPSATDPEDTWKIATAQGHGWIDRNSGRMLIWEDASLAQRVYDWAVVLHTGEAAWPWAVVLGLAGSSVLLFWWSGLVIWWQARGQAPHLVGNAPWMEADVLIFLASEGGTSWGFAQTLHDALRRGGHAVHTGPLEDFRTTAATRQVFSLFLRPGGRYQLTPLYDVLSAYPVLGQGPGKLSSVKTRWPWPCVRRTRMGGCAKSCVGTGRRLGTRHGVVTEEGRAVRFLIDDVVAPTPDVIAPVRAKLPEQFPMSVADAVLGGLQEAANRLAGPE